MNTTIRKHLAASAVLALLAACAGSPPYPAYAIENDAEKVSNVVVSDGLLQDVIRVGEPFVERMAGGELRVVVPVRNIDIEPIQLLAQIKFLDADQRTVGDTSNRQAQLIGPGSTVDLEWISHAREASDYVLRLSWNR